MRIEIFQEKHIADAKKITKITAVRENESLGGILPCSDIPDFNKFVDNSLGIVMIDVDDVIGYIAGFGPLDNFFGNVSGIYIPVHGHGVIRDDSNKIYTKMYQATSEIWVQNNILSHVITCFSHSNAINTFFDLGFGKRCIEAIYRIDKKTDLVNNDLEIIELLGVKRASVESLHNLISHHLSNSPSFMPYMPETNKMFLDSLSANDRIFAAYDNGIIIGYLHIKKGAESYISYYDKMMNIVGAYLDDNYRGKRIYNDILHFVINVLLDEGYTHLGVDYESINPAANSYWQKHFVPYTYSLARRIDERIIRK